MLVRSFSLRIKLTCAACPPNTIFQGNVCQKARLPLVAALTPSGQDLLGDLQVHQQRQLALRQGHQLVPVLLRRPRGASSAAIVDSDGPGQADLQQQVLPVHQHGLRPAQLRPGAVLSPDDIC